MALAARTIHVPAGTTINESARPELLEPGAASLAVVNGRQDDRGGLTKRLGYSAMALTRFSGSRSTGYKLFSHYGTPCVVDGANLDTYSEQAAAWVTKDKVSEAVATRVAAPWPGYSPVHANALYCNGYYVVCTRESSTSTKITLTVIDATTSVVVSGPTNVTVGAAQAQLPQIASVGTTAAVVWDDGAGGIDGKYISLASAADIATGWQDPAAAALVADYGNLGGVDFHGLENRFALGYSNNTGGGARLTVATFDTSLAPLATQTVAAASPFINQVALAGTIADTLWVAWTENLAVRLIGLNGTTLATIATVATVHTFATAYAVSVGIVVTGAGTGRLIATEDASCITVAQSFATALGAVSLIGAAQTWYNVTLLTRPWAVAGVNYAVVYCSTANTVHANAQGTLLLVDIDGTASLRVVATVAPRLGANSLIAANICTKFAQVSSTKFAVANLVTRTGGLGIGQGRGVELAVFDFAATNRWQAVPFAGNTYLSGGATSHFDRHRVREVNFHVRPPQPTVAAGGAGAVTVTNALYVAVYEKFDASGNCEISAASDPSAPFTTAATIANVTLKTLPLSTQTDGSATDVENPIRLAVYRSGDNGALPYRRIGTVDNVTTAATVVYADNTGSVASNAKLYTQPGQLGTAQNRVTPPGLHHVVAYSDMLVGVGDDLVTLWYSGQHVIGEGVWFADAFQVPVTDGGPITGLAVQDGTLFVFKRSAIFAVNGEPPSDNGTAGGLGTPRRLAVDVGCVDSRSIVVTTLGIFFQSARGIEILTRAQSVEWVGESVQTSLASCPVVTSAVLDEKASVVRFTCAQSETANQVATTGVHLVFDLSLKGWVSVDKVTATAGVESKAAQSAAMVYTGSRWVYAWLETTGKVWLERASSDGSAYLDDSAWVTLQWETPSFKVGLQQEQRIWSVTLLYERATSAGFSLEIAYGYGSYAGGADNRAWTAAEVLSGGRQLEFRPRSRETAMRFRFSDTAGSPTGTGKGCTWIGLSADLAPVQGATRGTPRLDPSLRK
jgi:hypothetical protein